MTAMKIETTIQVDGELHLTRLPIRKGDRVEAILRSVPMNSESAAESERTAARVAFLELARSSRFRSSGPYPTREALHERD